MIPKSTRTWQTEFPDFPPAAMPAIPAGFEDQSWRNDMSPRFVNEALALEIWVDFPDPQEREFPEMKRFDVTKFNPDTGEVSGHLLETDDWAEVEAFVASYDPEA